jgi:hypothetical protein
MSHSIDAAHDPSDRVRRGHLPALLRREEFESQMHIAVAATATQSVMTTVRAAALP